MEIIKVTNYSKKSNWGINLYLKEEKKIQIPNETVDTFLSKNLIKLSSKNILFLRKVSEQPKMQTEYH